MDGKQKDSRYQPWLARAAGSEIEGCGKSFSGNGDWFEG
jgi:hypothetical protein